MHEVIGRWSHREYETRLAWINDQWNKPDRHDYYIMMLAAEVHNVLRKHIQPDKFKMTFEIGARKKEEAVEGLTAKSKNFWGSLIGKATVRYKDPATGEITDGC